MFKRPMYILLAVAVLVIGSTAYTITSRDEAVPIAIPPAAEKKELVTVYVSGAVNKPSVVTIKSGERVQTAVNRCGGFLPTADIDAINMSEPVKDGMHILIPEIKDAVSPAMKARAATDKININRADEKELDKLPGIGPAMAKRIIDYRTEKGLFKSPEDLKRVRGIGEAKYEKLKDKITI